MLLMKKIAFDHGAAYATEFAHRETKVIFSGAGSTLNQIEFWHGPAYVKAFLAGVASVVIGEGV